MDAVLIDNQWEKGDGCLIINDNTHTHTTHTHELAQTKAGNSSERSNRSRACVCGARVYVNCDRYFYTACLKTTSKLKMLNFLSTPHLIFFKPVLNWANVCSPNILRTLRRTMIRFLTELLVRRIWFGLYFILNWLVIRCKLRPELAADAQQAAWSKM